MLQAEGTGPKLEYIKTMENNEYIYTFNPDHCYYIASIFKK